LRGIHCTPQTEVAQALINALIDTRRNQLEPDLVSGTSLLMSSMKTGQRSSLSVSWDEALDLIMGGKDGEQAR
jgi:hypothetical protein